MLPLIPIVIAAASYVVGKKIGEGGKKESYDEGYKEGYNKGHKEGYNKGLIQKVTVALRMQCPPEFRDRAKSAMILRKHGEDRVTVAYHDSNDKFLCRAEVIGPKVGAVLVEKQTLSI